MPRRNLLKPGVAALVVLDLILIFMLGDLGAAPPHKPKPKPHAVPHAKPHPVPHAKPHPKPIVKPHVKRPPKPHARPLPKLHPRLSPWPGRPMVVPKVAPRVVVRTGGAVVVRRGNTVIRPALPLIAVTKVEDLRVIPTKEFTGEQACQVVGVEDDYTVTLLMHGKETPVRLVGVSPILVADTESQPGVLPEAARRFARNLLVNEFVYVDYDATLARTDEDGNLAAYLYRAPDGLFVNLEMIRQGYALPADGYAFQFRDVFNSYEQIARSYGKGIWRYQDDQTPE